MQQEPDSQLDMLLAAARTGDALAFERFYNATVRLLLPVVRAICGDNHAEDVVADTYVQAWTSMESFDAVRGNSVGWLKMIARSRARDRVRRERVRHGRLMGAVEYDADNFPDTAPGPAEQAECRQQLRCLDSALDSLSRRDSGIMGLYMQECSHTEIASATGTPVGTVKTVISRARAKVRGMMESQLQLATPRHGLIPSARQDTAARSLQGG